MDFYCPVKSLVIEIDGDSHYEEGQQAKDWARDGFMKILGLKVLRFTNLDVMNNLHGVIDMILKEID